MRANSATRSWGKNVLCPKHKGCCGDRCCAMCIPEIADLHVQLCHSGVDFSARGRFAVERERCALRVPLDRPTDDKILLATRAFQFDLDVPGLLIVLDVRVHVGCAGQ